MVEIDIEDTIDAGIVVAAPMEDAEKIVNETIRDALLEKIVDALEDMAYIDIELDEEKYVFNVKASLVLCSKQDIATNAQMQAKEMAAMGLDEDQILKVLNIQIQDAGGF